MNCLNDFCCICFCKTQPFTHLSDTANDNVTYYFKLTSCVPEMCFKEINDHLLVCNKCCETMNIVYMFRQTCLRSKSTLRNYISQLPTVSAAALPLISIKQEYENVNNTETKIEQIYLFTDVEKYHNETENAETNSERNEINDKLADNKPCYFKIENIKKENDNQKSEKCMESSDISLENQDDVNMHSIENNINLTVGEIKEEKPDIEEHSPTSFDNYLANCDSNIEDREYVDKCYVDPLMNRDEIKTNIDDSEKITYENYVNATALDSNSHYKTMEEKLGSSVSNSIFKFQAGTITNKDNKMPYLKMHTEDKSHECNVCKKKFSLLYNLTRHMLIHTGEKPFECSICTKKFRQAGDLKTHTRIHTGEKPYECNICKNKFRLTGDLQIHMRIHTGEKPFECNICQKKFRQRCDLKIHIRIHTGEKPSECSVCQKKFSQLHNLKRHMRIHTGETPYECSVCEKKFNRSHHLKIHMRIHTGEKPYECTTCKKKFRQAGDLKIHTRIHTGEKPVCK